ncbi:MAG: hypothetical protein ACRETN_14825 [Nevskiales bacterium]
MFTSRGLQHLGTAALLSAVLALGACGGGGSSSDGISGAAGSGGTGGSGGSGGTGGSVPRASVEGPLDPVQEALSGIVGTQVGGALPAPLGPTVQCADTALTSFTDVPDALLVAVMALPAGADPAGAFQSAAAQMTASMLDFAGRLQSTLRILAGQASVCTAGTVGGNPLAGTPLEAAGAPLAALISALQAAGSNPNPAVLAAQIAPLLTQLDAAFGILPPEVTGAPVVGGLIATVRGLLVDVGALLVAIGSTDPVAAQVAIEALLDGVLTNALLGVLPVGQIDAASGQNFSAQIQSGIDTLTATLGATLGTLITPVFDAAIGGATGPLSNPVNGLIAQLLSGAANNPLDGILGSVAGGGVSPLDPLVAILTAGAGGVSLDNLAGALPAGGTGTPIDDLIDVVGGGAGLDYLLALMSLLNSLPLPAPLAEIVATVLGLA